MRRKRKSKKERKGNEKKTRKKKEERDGKGIKTEERREESVSNHSISQYFSKQLSYITLQVKGNRMDMNKSAEYTAQRIR